MSRFTTVTVLLCAFLSLSAAENRIKRLDGSTIATTEVDRTVVRPMSAGNVTGLGLAIFNDRRIAYLKAYGERDVDKHLPLTLDSVMTSASFTKSTFAYMVMQLT
jgi:CubicO group peptidase (beta-lactamase class C family)